MIVVTHGQYIRNGQFVGAQIWIAEARAVDGNIGADSQRGLPKRALGGRWWRPRQTEE